MFVTRPVFILCLPRKMPTTLRGKDTSIWYVRLWRSGQPNVSLFKSVGQQGVWSSCPFRKECQASTNKSNKFSDDHITVIEQITILVFMILFHVYFWDHFASCNKSNIYGFFPFWGCGGWCLSQPPTVGKGTKQSCTNAGFIYHLIFLVLFGRIQAFLCRFDFAFPVLKACNQVIRRLQTARCNQIWPDTPWKLTPFINSLSEEAGGSLHLGVCRFFSLWSARSLCITDDENMVRHILMCQHILDLQTVDIFSLTSSNSRLFTTIKPTFTWVYFCCALY